jgi:uncharacterized protein (TIGR02594 family)
MLNKRRLLKAVVTASFALPCFQARAEATRGDELCHGYETLQFLPPTVEASTSSPVGNNPSPAVDIAKAFRLMLKAPAGRDPIDVANYFNKLNVKSETKYRVEAGDSENLFFREEWPTPGPANPMIVGFFAATQLLPSGDQTAWCAAFVNYCLFVAGKQGTSSAASASFRKLARSSPSRAPATGDIAVFRDAGFKGDDPGGQGHVGFFVAPDDVTSGKYPARPGARARYDANPDAYVWVMGGNQRGADAGSTGGVKVAPIPVSASTILLGFAPVAAFKEIPES